MTKPKRTLLVASTGGHLNELYQLRDRLRPAADGTEWATFDDPQSRSLLANERVHFVRYIAPRDYTGLFSNFRAAERIIRRGGYDRVVSTGSGIALAFLPMARAHGVRCHYIESAARANGPSLTGKLVSRIPGVRLYSQYQSWSDTRWWYKGSLFESHSAQSTGLPVRPARRVVVTLGTMRTYGFRRAVDALARVLPTVMADDAQILWQVGATDLVGTGIKGKVIVPTATLRLAIAESDLVVAHAGIGSALTALDLGKCPVLLPRLRVHNEHVDDHQVMIARDLDRRGLAVGRDPDNLTTDDLLRAMSTCIAPSPAAPNFALVE